MLCLSIEKCAVRLDSPGFGEFACTPPLIFESSTQKWRGIFEARPHKIAGSIGSNSKKNRQRNCRQSPKKLRATFEALHGIGQKKFRAARPILLGILEATFSGPRVTFEALFEGAPGRIRGILPGGSAPSAPTLEANFVGCNVHWRPYFKVGLEYSEHGDMPYFLYVKPFDARPQRYMWGPT